MNEIPVEEFPGLDTNAGDGGGAGDIQNLRVDRAARLKTRPGYSRLYATAWGGATQFLGLHYNATAGATYLVSEDGVRRFTSNFTVATDDAKTGLTGSAIPVSVSSHLSDESVYFACETGVLQQWLPVVNLIDVADSPRCKYLCWMPAESRIIAAYAGFSSSSANGEQIVFSAPGGASWPTENTLTLEPQDKRQDDISGLCAWRDLVFVFKGRAFYVLTGTSESASGAAVMNHRAMHTGIGCAQPNAYGTTAGPDGVYFIGTDGIYRTTGDPPVLVSEALQRWWDGFDNGLLSQAASARNFTSITADSENVYVQNETAGLIFVYSTVTGQWTVYDLPITIGTMTAVGLRDFFFCDDTGRIYRSTDADTADVDTGGSASPIVWRYQTAFDRFGDEAEKVLREIKVEGTGSTVGIGVASDLSTTNPTIVDDLALGTSPVVGQARRRVAYRGRSFSCVIHGSGPASIERLVYGMRDERRVR
jgi:hypothetical protein